MIDPMPHRLLAPASVVACLALAGPLAAGTPGPDVIIRGIDPFAAFGTADGKSAFSTGVRPCNIGDTPVDWNITTFEHPVLVQNMFRLKGGRFEQIGMSWAAHEFCALQMDCDGCVPTNCASLGVGCMDQSWSSIVGGQQYLGARSEVDPTTGAFMLPFTTPGGLEPPILQGRLMVDNDDLDPALNVGAQYLIELLYVAADDVAAGNSTNNASWQSFTVAGPPPFSLSLTGVTREQRAAILGWSELDPTVSTMLIDVPSDGRFIVAADVTDNLDGTWSYEYAVYNQNSARGAGALDVSASVGVSITSVGFTDVDHHSGEPYDTTDWPGVSTGPAVSWSTTPHDVDPDANAIRWGTMYSFRFVADTPPLPSQVRLHLFGPGTEGDGDVVPVTLPGPRSCVSDVDSSGQTDIGDLLEVLGAWGKCAGCAADATGDTTVDIDDLLAVLAEWGACGT